MKKSTMKFLFLCVGFLAVAFTGSPAFAECLPNECCLEKECCTVSKDCAYGCSCFFRCSTDPKVENYCSCKCVGEPVSAVNPVLRIGLTDPMGMKNTSPFDLSDYGLHLQQFTNWIVQVDTDVENISVPSGERENTFENFVAALSQEIGVAYQVDEQQGKITFSSLP